MSPHTIRRTFIFPLFCLAAVASVPACSLLPGHGPAGPATASIAQTGKPVVTGTVTYRERMMAPPGSVLNVTLADTSRADATSVRVAAWSTALDGKSVPQAFSLRPTAPLDPRLTYTVRATINGPDGKLLWTNDTANRVPVSASGSIDMGELVMVKVTPYEAPPAAAPSLAGGSWKVTAMGATGIVSGKEPVVAFSNDGRVSGSGGCNRIFGNYEQDGAKLTVTALGATRMMCMDPGVMEQEAAFTNLLTGITEVTISPEGQLTVLSESGVSFTGERIADATGADPELLTGAEWIVEDINRTGIIDSSHLTLAFGADGRVSGSTNCNTFGGVYTADETTVTLAPLAMTRRACAAPAMAQQEQKYMAALNGEMAWTITAEDALELTGPAGQRLLLRR